MFDISDSWCWVYLHQLLQDSPSNGYSPQGVEFETSERVLTLSATTSVFFDNTKYKYFISDTEIKNSLRIKKGDILVQRSNSLEYVGVSCICPESLDNYIYPYLMIKPRLMERINIDYIYYFLSSPFTRQYFRESATGTSDTMKKINQNTLSHTIVALPPLIEQQRIVDRIKELFILVDMISSGKKLKIEEDKTALKTMTNIIELKPQLEAKKRVDVSSLGLVAREDGEVTQHDLDIALSEVQDFYGKKKK